MSKHNEFELNHSFRKFCRLYYDKVLKYFSGKLWYYDLHNFYIFVLGFIMLFSNNLITLTAILAIVSFDAISVVALHECPLTTLERKYLKKTSWKEETNF